MIQPVVDFATFGYSVETYNRNDNPRVFDRLREGRSEIDRFKIIWNLIFAHECEIGPRNVSLKSAQRSVDAREKGNELFRAKKYQLAVEEYSKAIIAAPYPPEEGPGANDAPFLELAYAYANRSAAFYSLGRYRESLFDTERAIVLKYPIHLLHKVKERKGLCFLAMNEHRLALTCFREARDTCSDEKINCSLDSKIAKTKKALMEKKGQRGTLDDDDFFPISWSEIPTVAGNKNAKVPVASDGIELVKVKASDKFEFFAKRDIEPGEVLLVEPALGHCMTVSESRFSCSRCLQYVGFPIPCRQCTTAIYCNEGCQMEAWSEYHKYECPVLNAILENSTESVNIRALKAALNVVILSSVKFIKEFANIGGKELKCDDASKKSFLQSFIREKKHEAFLIGSNTQFFSVKVLTPELQIKYGVYGILAMKELLMHTTLLQQLSKTPFVEALDLAFASSAKCPKNSEFGCSKETLSNLTKYFDIHSLKAMKYSSALLKNEMGKVGPRLCAYVATAIMHQAHIIQHSGRKITGFRLHQLPQNFQYDTPFELALGSFRYARYLPHSCAPKAMQNFYGKTIAITAAATIRKGETLTVARSVCILYLHETLEHRLQQLTRESIYGCDCRACVENWPTLPEFLEQRKRGGPEAIFICPRCNGFVPQLVACEKCSFPMALEIVKFLTESDSLVMLLPSYIAKVQIGTVTVEEAREMFKRACDFRKLAEKYCRQPSQVFCTVFLLMFQSLGRLGNHCYPKKKFGKS